MLDRDSPVRQMQIAGNEKDKRGHTVERELTHVQGFVLRLVNQQVSEDVGRRRRHWLVDEGSGFGIDE